MLAYICTYTPNGDGIVLVRVDPTDGTLTKLRSFAGPDPTWMALSPGGDHAYAVNEIDDFEGRAEGSVTAYAVDRSNGELMFLNAVGSGGTGPAHCSVHPSGRFVLVANYGSGHVAVLPVRADGSLGVAVDVQAPPGEAGPQAARHAPPGSFAHSGHDRSHAHMIDADPSGRFVLSTDLGLDRTFLWTLDQASGALKAHPAAPFMTASAGAGPRHFAFHPNGRVLYILGEEASELAVYGFDDRTGAATLLQSTSTLPKGFAGSSFASAIAISGDGRVLYTANRLHNSIARFAVDDDGRVQLLDTEWTRGDYPNHIVLDPTGGFLFACNRRSDQVTVFRVDQPSGALSFTGPYFPVGSPNMIAFARGGISGG
jgi:6-phosphogluconolactonase (cycloisomerase 2 family)